MSKEKKAQKLQEKADKAAAKAEKAASKTKKSKSKIIGGIVVAILALALIGNFLPESDSSDVEVNMDDYPAWVEFEVDKSAPLSDTEALLDAAMHLKYSFLSEKQFNKYIDNTYEPEEAQYIKENLVVSWNPVCGLAVDNYAKKNLSRNDIVTALEKDGFTAENIEYAQVNLDSKNYNEAAYERAKDYRDKEEMSYDAIAYQLVAVDNFEESEALYALTNLQ